MAFEICLCDEIKAQLIGKVIEVGMVRLVSCTNSVDVALLHPDHVCTHGLVRNSPTGVCVMFVSVHAVDDDRLAVNQHIGTAELDTMKADFLADKVLASLQHDGVKCRCLRGPEVEIVTGNLHSNVSGGRAIVSL